MKKKTLNHMLKVKSLMLKNTVRDVNVIFKMMYERSKMYQLNYHPELKLLPYYPHNIYKLICYNYSKLLTYKHCIK